MMAVLYLSSLIRSVLALHDLIDNKSQRAFYERERVSKGCGWRVAQGGKGLEQVTGRGWGIVRGCLLLVTGIITTSDGDKVHS